MGLPDSRERTYTDDTPVDPNDLNAIQDSIIALSASQGILKMPFFQLQQNWMAPMFASWTNSSSFGGTMVTNINHATDRPGVWLRLRAPGDADAQAGGSQPGWIVASMHPDLEWVLDFAVDATAMAGTPDYEFVCGLMHDTTWQDDSTEDLVRVRKSSASANWIFQTRASGGGSTNTNTGVAAGGVQRFRIQAYGASDSGGARCELYIDGALVATNTTNLPAEATSFGMQIAALFHNSDILVANVDVFVSPISFLTRWV